MNSTGKDEEYEEVKIKIINERHDDVMCVG